VIYFPAVVCTSSPSTSWSSRPHGAAEADAGPPNSNTGSSVLVCIGRHRMISSGAEFAYQRPGYHLGVMPAVGDLVRSGRPSVARLLSSPDAT
jgi:hypothetical protein